MNFRKHIFSILLLVIAITSVIFFLRKDHPEVRSNKGNSVIRETLPSTTTSEKIPSYVQEVFTYIQTNQRAPEGYVGGRVFQNREHRLPPKSSDGRKIIYREWDVHSHERAVNRGPERLITGDDGSAYFTNDHYTTFHPINSLP